MSALPSISVVIPVYQASEYIDACLQSLAAQDYPGPIECILVDDCGTDDSMEKARLFAASHSGEFRFLRHDCNRGAAAARNTGMARAAGEYLYFLDSDDTLPPDALSTLAAPLAERHYDMVVGRYQESQPLEEPCPSLPDGTVLEGAEILHQYLRKQLSVIVCNKLYRTAFIRQNKLDFVEGIIYEDDLWSFQAAVVARSLYVVDRVTYFYAIHPGSVMTATALQKRVRSFKTIMMGIYNFGLEHGLRPDYAFHHRLEQYRLNLFRMLMPHNALFVDTYLSLRQELPKPWRDCFRLDGLRLNKQIRDFHLLLPAKLGAAYMRGWFKVEAMLKKKGV